MIVIVLPTASLVGAWNWLTGDTENILYKEETNAANAASSVFFLTLVVCQMGHLLSIRKKAPYFSEVNASIVSRSNLLIMMIPFLDILEYRGNYLEQILR